MTDVVGKVFGVEIGKILKGESLCYSMSHLCLVLVLFSMVSFLLQNNESRHCNAIIS